ncbi:hypothetical protein [Streptomyces telluris]|uniref:Uncharacterized protein n=1 Tax=Streptomyces telluris TaxID=2720021 RepID=A0A9X2LJD5_9ACTN|nr:hypothetical protein [Streptomyces telluris]MCQ8772046.1 hypothetical protein [Streptomyces telluris]NJP78840.1 hypothetical protein [Streptomyces telluris]
MALAFKTREFQLRITPSADEATDRFDFEFPSDIREDSNGYVVDAVLQSFKFENFVNGSTEDWEIGGESVKLEVTNKARRKATVVVRTNIRPQEAVARTNPAFQFRATVTVLAIADLKGSTS